MFNILITSLKYSFAEKGNKTLYNLNKIPLIKKAIGDKFYKETEGKNVFGIIGFIFGMLLKFIIYTVMLFILIKGPSFLINEYRGYGSAKVIMLQISVVMGLLPGLFLTSSIFNAESNDYNMIKILRVNPKEYYLTKIIMNIKEDIICLAALSVLNIDNVLLLTLEFMSINIIGEYIQIVFFHKFNFIVSKTKKLKIVLWILVLILSYVPCVFGLVYDFSWIIQSYMFLIFVMGIVGISFIQMRKYNGYKDIVLNMNLRSVTSTHLEEIKKEAIFGDVEIDEVEDRQLDLSAF